MITATWIIIGGTLTLIVGMEFVWKVNRKASGEKYK